MTINRLSQKPLTFPADAGNIPNVTILRFTPLIAEPVATNQPGGIQAQEAHAVSVMSESQEAIIERNLASVESHFHAEDSDSVDAAIAAFTDD